LDRTKLVSRAGALVLSGTLILGGLVAAAHADNAIGRALHERKVTVHKLERIHDLRRVARQNLHHQIRETLQRIHKTRANGPALASDRARWSKNQQHLTGLRRDLRQRLARLERYVRRRTVVLRTQRLTLTQWIQTYGIFRECPVDGTHSVANDFGVWVIKVDVPKHIHQGNDITAASGTPIVAPFDGVAEASSNTLGGLAVKVFGDEGYVYNAHLSSYGTLGKVTAGTIIGYVGSTGDAGGPHDHFEWHPGNGSAVDPYPYLMAVC
jgi:murein DD-endopeptidase MepM/ murein hydrolase activator NlpD